MRNLLSVLLLIVSFPLSSVSQVYNQVQKIISSDRASGDVFGYSVSVSGNYAIIGAQYEAQDSLGFNTLANSGSAYIFERDNNGQWNQKQKIVASDRTTNDFFGCAVSICGNRAVIGAFDKNAIGGNTFLHAGAAYIFERNGNGNWNEVKKIIASDTGANDHFAYTVAISESYVIVGSPIEAEDVNGGNTLGSAGSAYIFEQDGYGNWSQVQKIVADDRAAADLFGSSVAISGNSAIVGSYQEDENPSGGNTINNAGSAYIFERDGNGIWVQKQKIIASDRTISDRFGISVSISGASAIVGSYLQDFDETGGNYRSNAGAAYIFERDGNNNWIQTKKITAPDRDANDYFGESVNINGNYLIVGAQNEATDAQGGNSITSAGAAYIFKRNGTGNWSQSQKIVAADRSNNDLFSFSVAISDSFALVGAYLEDEDLTGGNPLNGAGSAYFFEACHPTSSIFSQTVCSSYTSPSGNQTWTIEGTYTDTIPNATGCDSVMTINLLLNSSSSLLNLSACYSYSSPSGNYIWSSSNTYKDTIQNAYGCDSVITIQLTINNSSSTLYETACHSYTSPSGNYTWTNSGIYLDTIPNMKGCDSVMTIHLTLNNSSSTISQTACNNYTSPSGKYIWTSSNTYVDTIANSQNCDSIISILLTINTLSTSATLYRTACVSYTSPSGNYTWSNPGTYMDTILNAAGCDSLLTIILTINTIPSSSTLNQTVCSSYTSPSGNYTWTSSNTYMDTIPNSEGCDSLITINLTINNTQFTLNEIACNSYASPSGNHIWTSSGIYKDTIPNNIGCDSIITVNLSIKNSYATIIQTACYSYTSPSGNHIWTSANTYFDTIPNAAGCDSIMNINLTFINSTSTIYQTACSNYTSPSGNYTWSGSNTYSDTIPNAKGCDSIITIYLTILSESTGPMLNQTVCNSYTSASGNYVWTSSNTYSDTIPNAVGCDSIITINLTVNTTSISPIINQSACNSFTSPSGNYTWTSSNTYWDTIPNAKSCDSILNINLTIYNIYTTVSQNGTTLTADTSGGTYQWIDCANANSYINGAVNQNYTATINGNYAVVFSENGCADTSSCYIISSAGLMSNSIENKISISPNPAHTVLIISFELSNNKNAIVKLISSSGKTVYSQPIKKTVLGKYDLKIKTDNFANGLYYIVIENGYKQLLSKVIIDN